jgi:hypothetical protein
LDCDNLIEKLQPEVPCPIVYIIILNWNGLQDTIECLESILQSDYPNYCIILIDNGSSDNSCEQIQSWARGDLKVETQYVKSCASEKPIQIVIYDRVTAENGGIVESEREISSLPSSKKLVLIKCEDNLGFAGGCNIGVRYVMAVGGEYVWLLNNDTVIESSALLNSVRFMENHLEYQGVTGQIRLYNNPSVIWNCGGKLSFYGTRRYYFCNSNVTKVPQNGFRKISFITGCAPLFRASLFKKIGLLTELFFFGEEDFELSLRLKRSGYKIACLYDAIIYHKVGNAINLKSNGRDMSKIYIYYLNRFINIRHYWPKFPWKVWRFCYFFYIFPLLRLKYGTSWKDLFDFRNALMKDSSNLDRVSKNIFEQILRDGFGKNLNRTIND